MSSPKHEPVLLREVLTHLRPAAGERVLDVTLGLGGHATLLLQAVGTQGSLTGIDADAENLRIAQKTLSHLQGNVQFLQGNFREMIATFPAASFDVIFADLGVSSPHFDDPDRGFTFRADAPLDMRYDRSVGMPASTLIRVASEQELFVMFCKYGEMQGARRLAVRLKESPPETTSDLRQVAEELFGYRAPSVLAQIFQALRIAVNDEIGALERLLDTAPGLLSPGGRFGVISYHSLEDRLVKQRFRALSTPEIDDRTGSVTQDAEFVLPQKKPIVPGDEECRYNPRSRSAKFRWIEGRLP